jgi:hypothetical protein
MVAHRKKPAPRKQLARYSSPDARSESQPGAFAAVALCVGLGLLICSITDALSRATLAPPPVLYWAGILLIALPVFFRVSMPSLSPRHRLGLVLLLGMALYFVKLARDSFAFNLPDEPIHAFNAEQIAQHHHLFHSNPILPITPDFPGLEGATSALMSLTGLSTFGAGAIVIGAARLILIIGLFVLFRRISRSARIAGIGVALYACNSNFLLWGAQFSYESLALPLLVVVLAALAERAEAPPSLVRAWAFPIGLAIAAIVVTHHLTSYALTTILIAFALAHLYIRRRGGASTSVLVSRLGRSPWPFTVLSVGLVAFWLAVVASSTAGYLSPVISKALSSTLQTISGESSPRALFQSTVGAQGGDVLGSTPVLARLVALSSVVILAVGLPFGLVAVWRRHRDSLFALTLCVAGVGFFGFLILRFAPAAWETSNRAGEFLFLGVAFVLAFTVVQVYSRLEPRGRRSVPWLGHALLTASFGLVLVGGAVSGWPWDSQLASTLRARASGRTIDSEPLAAAQWVSRHLPDGRFAAADADARFLLAPGGVTAYAGVSPDIEDIISNRALAPWMLPLLRDYHIRYVVGDRRRLATNITRGYFFAVRRPAGPRAGLLPRTSLTKFEGFPATRILDSGRIVIYDTRGSR